MVTILFGIDRFSYAFEHVACAYPLPVLICKSLFNDLKLSVE